MSSYCQHVKNQIIDIARYADERGLHVLGLAGLNKVGERSIDGMMDLIGQSLSSSPRQSL